MQSTAFAVVVGHGIKIQCRGLRAVAFLANDHLNAVFLGLVADLFNQFRMRNAHEFLIVDLPNVHGLFPAGVMADHQRA
ncbi:hypothetical protein D3C86_2126780 [compost metagenome]